MAPAKRRANTVAGGAAKRSARDPVLVKCSTVATALRKADDIPKNVREMLADMVPASLSVMVADRHPFQAKTVEMVEEVLKGVEAKLQSSLTEAQAKVDGAETEKGARAAAVAAAQSSLSECKANLINARDADKADKASLREAKMAANEASAALARTEAELNENAEQQATLASAAEVFANARSSKLGSKKMLDTIGSALEDICRTEASLVSALDSTLKKDPSKRGSFDSVIEEKAADAFSSTAARLKRDLGAADSTKAAAAATLGSAEAAAGAATEKSKASHLAFEAAAVAMKSAEEALKDANEAVEKMEEETIQAAATLEKAIATLEAFQGGPFVAFSELKSLAPDEEDAPEDAAADM